MTIGRLLSLTQSLQTQLDNLTNQVERLRSDCTSAGPGVPTGVCNNIPTLSYTVTVDYGVVRNVHQRFCLIRLCVTITV